MNQLIESLKLPERVEPVAETAESQRGKELVERVWSKVPNHLWKRPLKPEYSALVREFNWTYSFLLLGATGNGKTTAAIHLVRRLLKEGKVDEEAFVRAKSIFWARADAITSAGKGDELHNHQVLHRAANARLFILDDLAEASKTIYKVIQARYDNPDPRPIIVTSGASNEKDFASRVGGDAILRWIIECGGVRRGVILGAK